VAGIPEFEKPCTSAQTNKPTHASFGKEKAMKNGDGWNIVKWCIVV
jgi:hypothetical protein